MGALKEARFYTIQLLDLVDSGVLNKDVLINDLLKYMSDEEVADFMCRNEYILLCQDLYVREE